jgi:hypothetical protein
MDVIELWWLSLAIAGVVIVVVAVLLGLIIAAAKSIDRHASSIWIEGKKIAGNTVSIWILEQVDAKIEAIEQDVRSMERSLNSIDNTLRKIAVPGRGRD